MFRDVPEYSMFLVLSTAVSNTRRNVMPDFQSLTSEMIEKKKKKKKGKKENSAAPRFFNPLVG